MSKPNFFMVGAPKCGTTAWSRYLGSHSDISFGDSKEPHYFNRDICWKRNTTWGTYLSGYEHVQESPIVGDASVLYLYSKEAARLIFEVNPQAKILILLREHVSFLRSWHNETLYTNIETEQNFASAWKLSRDRQAGRQIPGTCPDGSLLDYTNFADFYSQVKRYFDVFPEDNIRVCWMDEWVADPRGTYLSIMRFLDLEDDGRQDFDQIGAAKDYYFSRLGRLTATPVSNRLLVPYRYAKKVLGIKRRTMLVRKLRLFNTRTRKLKPVDHQVAEEIRELFSQDRSRIDALRSQITSHA